LIDGSTASAATLVGELDRRVPGESELHHDRHKLFRAAWRPIYPWVFASRIVGYSSPKTDERV
jgi:hypothetical protein